MSIPPTAPSIAAEERSLARAVLPHVVVTLILLALTIEVNFRGEYLILTVFWGVLALAGPRSRRFANMATAFLMVGILYDQILPHLFQFRPEPHVADLYHLEQKLFGIHTATGVIIPSEWFEQHTSPWLDVPTGFGYMTYMFESFLVAAWMFFKDEEQTVKLAWAFLMVGILYDQILPHLFQFRPEPHVADLYHLEQKLFGIHTANGIILPSEWFEKHTSPWLDVPTGFGYMTYMFESFIVAAWMFFKDEEQTVKLAWAFLIVNIIGFTCWIVFPAAPPWYVAKYGLGPAHMDAIPSAAGCERFDAIFGISYFTGFYQRSHNVYGAMPSLHVSYPLVVLLAVWRMPQRWLRWSCAAFFVLVTFAAVYLSHHYIVDAIAGIATAFVAYGLMLWIRGAVLRRRAIEPAEALSDRIVAP